MAFSITTLGIMMFGIMTLSTMTQIIMKPYNDTHHNETL
jgi:hypothetical protein